MDTKLSELKKLGAGEFTHLHGSLIDHLTSTYLLLKKWGASNSLCDAGLYHAAYGTAGFEDNMASLTQRKSIAQVIGDEAEALVYLYCACDREYVFSRLMHNEKTAKKMNTNTDINWNVGSTDTDILFRDRFTGKEYVLSAQQAHALSELTVANELELVLSSDEFKAQHGDELFRLFDNLQSYLSHDAIKAYQVALI